MPTPKKKTAENKKLGQNIAKFRIAAGFTQEELAEKAGVSTRYVQDLERGLYTPTIFITNNLRKILQASWDELLKGC